MQNLEITITVSAPIRRQDVAAVRDWLRSLEQNLAYGLQLIREGNTATLTIERADS